MSKPSGLNSGGVEQVVFVDVLVMALATTLIITVKIMVQMYHFHGDRRFEDNNL